MTTLERLGAVSVVCFVVACGRTSDVGSGSGAAAGAGGAVGSAGNGGSQSGSGPGGAAQGGAAQGGSGPGGAAQGGAAQGGGGNAGHAGNSGEAGSGGTGGVTGTETVLGEGFVAHDFELGEHNPSGGKDVTAWQYYGVDLDGLDSSEDSADHCQLQAGANPAEVKPDGPNGLDNSFGANILPALLGLQPSLTSDLQRNVDGGISLALVTGPNVGVSDVVGSLGRAHSATNFYDLSRPWYAYDSAYPGGMPNCPLVGGTFQNQLTLDGTGFWDLRIPLQSTEFIVRIHQPRVRADVDPVTQELTNVSLAGVIRTEELVEAFRQVVGVIDASYCTGTEYESLANHLRAASDIRDDGQNGDPSLPCNGISFGMGVKLDPALIKGFVLEQDPPQGCL